MAFIIYDVKKSRTLGKGSNDLTFNMAVKKKASWLEFYFKKYILFFNYKSISNNKIKHKKYL
jgi:hypothetical protein